MRPGSGCAYQEACHGVSALLSPWTARDSQREGCGERGNKWKGSVAGGGLKGPVGVLPFIFVVCTPGAILE